MKNKQRIITISVAALMLASLCAACATTSVTASAIQNSSGAPANGLDSGTAVCSWGVGRLDVFARGTNGNLWHKWWDGSWHSWEDLGAPTSGSLTSAPTAVSWGAGRIDVFARGYGGSLQHKWFEKGWHDWENLGVPFGEIMVTTAPAAASWGAGRLDIFVMGDDGQLYQKWFYNGWQAWVPLGKPSTTYVDGSPGAVSTVSWGYPRVDIFVRGGDGALWQLWWKNGWQAWHRFDDTAGLLGSYPGSTAPIGTPYGYYGTYYYAPAVCSWGANRLDVFFVDTNYHLQQKYFDNGWQPLYLVGGSKLISAAPSAVAWQNAGATRLDIFARGDDFGLSQLTWSAAGGWNGWYNLGLLYTPGTTTTTTTISADITSPLKYQTVTFTVTLKSGTAGLSKSVTIWWTAPDGTRVDEGTYSTVNGVYTFTQAFYITGQIVYHAEFTGDSQYAASSGTVVVNVL